MIPFRWRIASLGLVAIGVPVAIAWLWLSRGDGPRDIAEQVADTAKPPDPNPDVPPELVLDTGHTGFVSAVGFSPDGRLLASAAEDGTVKLWDLEQRRELRSLPIPDGQEARLTAPMRVGFSPDGKWVHAWLQGLHRDTSGFWSWDVAAGGAWPPPDYGRWSADRRYYAVVRPEGVFVIECCEKSEPQVMPLIPRVLVSIDRLLFDADSRLLVVHEQEDVRASVDYEQYRRAIERDEIATIVRVIEVRTSREICRIEAPRPARYEPAFSPDGRWIALIAPKARSIDLYDTKNGCRARQLTGIDGASLAVFSPNSRWLAAAADAASHSADKTPPPIVLWDLNAGTDAGRSLTNASASDLAFSPDSSRLALAAQDGVRYWDAASGWNHAKTIDDSASAVAFSADGRRLAWAWRGGAEIRIRNVDGGDVASMSTKVRPVDKVALSGDGRWLAAIGRVGDEGVAAQLWDVPSGRVTPAYIRDPISTLAFDAGSRSLIAAGQQLRSFDVLDFWREPEVLAESAPLSAITRDGQLVVTAAAKSVRVHHVPSAKDRAQFSTEQPVIALAVGASAERIAVASGDPAAVVFGIRSSAEAPRSAVTLHDAATGAEIRRWDVPATEVALSPDGRWLAMAAGDGQQAFQLWDVAANTTPLLVGGKRRTLLGAASAPAFSGDSALVAFGDATHAVQVWDTARRQQVATLQGHTDRVASLVFSADRRFLISGAKDGTIRVWSVADAALLATIVFGYDPGNWLVVTPDGLFDGSPGGWDAMRWRFGGSTFDLMPGETFFTDFYHPGLLADVLQGRQPKAPRRLPSLDRRLPLVRVSSRTGSPGEAIDSRMLRVQIDVSEAAADATRSRGSGVKDVRLFRNGALVKAWRGAVSGGRATLFADVPLMAGENRFTAYAFNADNIKSADATLTMKGGDALARRGRLSVITIGIDDYANRSFNLRYAVADAQRFAEVLAGAQQGTGEFERIDVVPLLNADATKATILGVIRRLAGVADAPGATPTALPGPASEVQPSDPEDVVVVFFAGHGINDGARFYLVPHDLGAAADRGQLDADALRTIASHSISDQELEQALESVDARHLMLVIDACHSGQALESEEQRRGPMNARGLAQLAHEKGMYVVTAAQAYQAALENARLGHGFLTYALVEDGLARGAADRAPQDGRILAREWLDFAAERVPQLYREQVSGDRALRRAEETANVQRPRVFYRRELDLQPLVISTGVARRRTN